MFQRGVRNSLPSIKSVYVHSSDAPAIYQWSVLSCACSAGEESGLKLANVINHTHCVVCSFMESNRSVLDLGSLNSLSD